MRGVVIRWRKLAPKTAAVITAATATIMPDRALRTGTAVRPRPGSRAIRTPIPAVTGSARASRCVRAFSGGRVSWSPGAGWPATRQAAGASRSSGSSAMRHAPAPSTATLTSTPGAGSASRAGPMGISGDAATAPATARMLPATLTQASRASEMAIRPGRVVPRARSTGKSAESSTSCRASSWPSTASAMSAISAANAASATTCGRMACCAAAVLAVRSTTYRPWVPG